MRRCQSRRQHRVQRQIFTAGPLTFGIAICHYASEASPTTSAVVRLDGTVLAWQPYGVEGLLLADLELSEATGLLASRCRS